MIVKLAYFSFMLACNMIAKLYIFMTSCDEFFSYPFDLFLFND